MSTWSEFPSKALWTASIITQMPSMPPTASLVNRPSSSMLCFARSPPIWSRGAPNAANLALANGAQKTINYLPNLVKKCARHHTETGREINPKCALTSCHSAQGFIGPSLGIKSWTLIGLAYRDERARPRYRALEQLLRATLRAGDVLHWSCLLIR